MRTSDTLGQYTPQGGTPLAVPEYWLTMAEAVIVRDYVAWLEHRNITQTVYCLQCRAERGGPCEVEVTPSRVRVMCRHQMLVYSGDIPVRQRDYTAPPKLILPVGLAEDVIERLTQAEADVIFAYQTVSREHRIASASWCNPCWEADVNEGCGFRVQPGMIDVICQHRHMTYRAPR